MNGIRPLQANEEGVLRSRLSDEVRLLDSTEAIEAFLVALDGKPPDWSTVYGNGHHDRGLDDRLFSLNRARDAARADSPFLTQRVAFVWPGELSDYEDQQRGYRVAIGPKLYATSWGVVRFKPDGLPSRMIAVPSPTLSRTLRQCHSTSNPVEIRVIMTGRLIPEESIMYDFSHELEGHGMVMPVIRIEQVDYVLSKFACLPPR